MSHFQCYYAPKRERIDAELAIHSLGIRETMPPGAICHGGSGFPYLAMFFHDPAQLNPGQADQLPATRRFILWAPGTQHHYGRMDGPWCHSWLIFSGNAADRLLNRHHIPLNRLLDCDSEALFEKYLSLLYAESIVRSDPYVQQGLLDLFFYELQRVLHSSEKRIPAAMQRTEEYMWEHLSQPVTLKELAGNASLSIPRFAALFRICYGDSPMHSLLVKRMTLAAELLKYRQSSCKEIAARVGYPDQLQFSRRFRQFHGVSPTQYREAAQPAPNDCEPGSRKPVISRPNGES